MGIRGFLSDLEDFYGSIDEESSEWEAFLTAWRHHFGSDRVTIATASAAFEGDRLLVEALPADLASSLGTPRFRQRLGMAMRGRIGRRYGDEQLHVEQGSSTRDSVATWGVDAS